MMNTCAAFLSSSFFCLLSTGISANDIMKYSPSDASILKNASLVVQGRVTDVANFPSVKKGCFTNVFKLQVEISFKGGSEGEIVQIGSLSNRIDLAVGDRFLIVLNDGIKQEFNLYDYCKYPRLDKSYSKKQLKVTRGSIASSYRISAQNFSIVGCGASKRILLQNELLKVESTKYLADGDCDSIQGEYAILINTIENTLAVGNDQTANLER